ncbi:type II toxin-antitoxin system VapC family toxin [Iamia sp.]|uniref:type II toxin-antitoxin system VapC family toxin n=1 Tax=Iamia sp. TaxID=2722710 RepID=UPI002C103F77|nr:type II toxin-antitoxin system VapC family toxin [Iamia sp.]HXH56327.1 type II toxin-antitoxin system VapC family toxin [Iamia sp.]
MGLTVLDAGVLIGFLDRNDTHHESARRALDGALDRNDRLVVPASALAETLVGPSRRGADAVATVRRLLERVPIDVAPLDRDVATVAAALRARHRALKLPNALVIATTDTLDADLLVTTDRRWPPRSRLGLRAMIARL